MHDDPLPPAVQTWFERHAQASTDAERQALVTALCAWQRAHDVAEIRKENARHIKEMGGYHNRAIAIGWDAAATHLEALK